MPDSLSRSQREDGITPADSRESQNRFCKETTRRRPKTCKYHYFAGDNQSHRSTACGFFTDDYDMVRKIDIAFGSARRSGMARRQFRLKPRHRTDARLKLSSDLPNALAGGEPRP